ncbi:MAG TPA: hypothetical protein VFQ68_16365 [Streptosporangiaceae bacterium]|nr:hypothetical protein [Streptosporangiaceae bacterium]
MSAELAARRTAAAAVLGDYRAALASAPLTQPPGREWMLRLADALGMLLDGLAAVLGPPGGEGAQCHGLSCGCPECDNDEPEPYCRATVIPAPGSAVPPVICGAAVGLFIGHGDAWLHYRGEGTAADPVELYDAGHAPEVAWRPAGAR